MACKTSTVVALLPGFRTCSKQSCKRAAAVIAPAPAPANRRAGKERGESGLDPLAAGHQPRRPRGLDRALYWKRAGRLPRCPDVAISLQPAPVGAQLLDALDHAKLDLALAPAPAKLPDRYTTDMLFSDELVTVTAPRTASASAVGSSASSPPPTRASR